MMHGGWKGKAAAMLVAGALLQGCAGMERQTGRDGEEAADINAELGIGYLREGEMEQAERSLKRALEFDRRHAMANLGMATVYERRGAVDEAVEHYEVALAQDPDDPHIQVSTGAMLCRQGEFERAQDLFEKAINNVDYDRRDVALLNSGSCYADEGEYERAEQRLRDALERSPENPRALLELASVSYQAGKPMQTRAFLQRLSGRGIENAETLLLCYQSETALGRDRNASACADRLRDEYPDSDEAERLRRLEREVD